MEVRTCCAVIALFPAIGIAVPAVAQTAATPSDQSSPTGQATTAGPAAAPNEAVTEDGQIGDIIVTAQKRAESVQRTPLAITALTGDALQQRGVSNLTDLQAAVPNVNIQQRTSYGVVTIRGVGFDILTAGSDSSVAVHQDGVYVSRPAAALATLFDVERIEIARGPQGTLYGRNATGGAVNIISRKPTDELSGYLTASYGNYNAVTLEGAIGGAIDPGLLSIRIAGRVENRDGYGTNLFNGRDVDDLRTRAFRVSLRFTPASNLTADLVVDYFREKDSNFVFHYAGAYDPNAPVLAGIRYGGRVAPYIRDVANDLQPINDREFYGAGLNVDWEVGNGITLRSISGARRAKSYFISDLDQTTFNYTGLSREEREYQLSQELQGLYHNDKVDAIIGGYYFYEHNFGGARAPFGNTSIPTLPHTGAAAVNYPRLDQRGLLVTRAEAIFGQITYRFTDQLSATVGGRYSHESKDVNETSRFIATATRNAGIDFSAFTPKFGLQFQANKNVLAYASISRGFKSGGYALGQVIPSFDPETIWAYEAGLKVTTLDGRLRANGAVFHYNYKDLQQGFVSGIGTAVINADAKIDGAEIELEGRPVRELTLTANASYLNARFTRFEGVDDPGIAGINRISLNGNRLSQAPRFTFNAAAQYNFHTDAGTFAPRVEYVRTSKYFFTPFNVDRLSQSAYGLLNASLRFSTANDKWWAELYGRNLTDKLAYAGGFVGFAGVGAPEVVSLVPPRTYGVRVGTRF